MIRTSTQSLREQVKQYSLDQLYPREVREVTVGVEHEFFLFGPNGQLATFEFSQKFLLALSKRGSWRIFFEHETNLVGTVITRVSRQGGQPSKYTAVKYEFPPYLLEVAFTYFADLNALYKEIQEVWDDLEENASDLGGTIRSLPSIEPRVLSEVDCNKVDSKYLDLSLSRRAFFDVRAESVDEMTVDFPAYIAATQIHIAGFQWWNNFDFVGHLYSLEAAVQPISYLIASNGDFERASKISLTRWNAYLTVFRGLKLLGFPDLQKSTIDDWIGALCESPLVGSPNDSYTGKTLNDLNLLPSLNVSIEELFSRTRDLQILRPKLIGTIEFRSEPAMSSPREILMLAALKLGQYLMAVELLNQNRKIEGFQKLREQWWLQALDLKPDLVVLRNMMTEFKTYLSKRGRREEKFLEGIPF